MCLSCNRKEHHGSKVSAGGAYICENAGRHFYRQELRVVDRAVFAALRPDDRSFVAARKNWQLARLLGISFVFGLLLGG